MSNLVFRFCNPSLRPQIKSYSLVKLRSAIKMRASLSRKHDVTQEASKLHSASPSSDNILFNGEATVRFNQDDVSPRKKHDVAQEASKLHSFGLLMAAASSALNAAQAFKDPPIVRDFIREILKVNANFQENQYQDALKNIWVSVGDIEELELTDPVRILHDAGFSRWHARKLPAFLQKAFGKVR